MQGILPSIFDDAGEEEALSHRTLDVSGRQLSSEDATIIVSTGTLVLGIIFTVTTLALYAYYYSTTFDLTSGAQNKNFNSRKGKSLESDNFLTILGDLERAFTKFGLQNQDEGCKKKIICEVLLPDSTKKNPTVAEKLANILNRGFDTSHAFEGEPSIEQQKVDAYLTAARTGHSEKSCKRLEKHCPQIHLDTL